MAPRRARMYLARGACAGGMLILIATAWFLVTGTQVISSAGELARFGNLLFQFLAPLMLVLVLAASALAATSAVAAEKDRRTLTLLFLTRLTNSELVLGKLLASLLLVGVTLAAAFPVFMLLGLLGGVSFSQIGRVFITTAAAGLVAGSLGGLLAFWREKTFQTLALVTIGLAVWIIAGEALAYTRWAPQGLDAETFATWVSPWRAARASAAPFFAAAGQTWTSHPAVGFWTTAFGAAALLNIVAILQVRRWQVEETRQFVPDERENKLWSEESAERQAAILAAMKTAGGFVHAATSAEQRRLLKDLAELHTAEGVDAVLSSPAEPASDQPRSVHAAAGRYRPVWDNPVLWREVRTWAYGRKVLLIKFIYLLFAAAAAFALYQLAQGEDGLTRLEAGSVIVPLAVLSLVLVNAQAVTSFSVERDLKSLDLLLVTDLRPAEFVFGKLGGVFYNAKEMLLAPILLSLSLVFARDYTGVQFAYMNQVSYLAGGLLVLNAFVAMLGLHAGMTYVTSRGAIGVSLGTVFFLFLGVATCMWMMVAFSGSFAYQLWPFVTFLVGGGVALYLALGIRNPSNAIALASFLSPFATFYAITSLLQGFALPVFLVVAFNYGFATAAMLVPALDRFDVALGRTTSDELD